MKIKLLITLIGVLAFNVIVAQNQEKYSEYVKEALNLYMKKDFKESAEKFEEAFDQLDGKAYPNDRYNAACSYALANNVDSCHCSYIFVVG